ncbi:unnamed protein product [Angiostrongylus costaricensis]|uniref:Endo/exonuclease/phosphatase domain-containing protein n=1 Tax=Angiostrongylus costaricensis TaxID=334426 RepID=A0A158PHA8_ANGCS|nr:unnamed protein product [Angiostrongylus costaricensis]
MSTTGGSKVDCYSESSQVPITVEVPHSKNVESLTLGDVLDSEQFLFVGGVPYEVIHEPADISTVACVLKPLADCPVYPAVDFRQGSRKVKPKIHWFIYNPQSRKIENSPGNHKKNGVNEETLKLIDGPSRRFSVSNCEFRCTGDFYVPSVTDIGKQLFLVADLGPQAVVKIILSGVKKKDRRTVFSIRMVSYNILADLYLDLSGSQEALFFPYCPKDYQTYEYRYPLLLKELSSYVMDLCFLQEVDHRMQMRYLSVLFESIGLEMCFTRKQKEVTEGSVIAFNRRRFEYVLIICLLLSSESYWIASLLKECYCDDLNKILTTSVASLDIFTSRPTTLQVVVLRDRRSNEIIICGNTHLHHNPKHEHLKVFQAIVAVRQLHRICQDFSNSSSSDETRLIFAGDFNSTPDGPVYEILSTDIYLSLQLLPSRKGLNNLTGTGCTNHTRHTNVYGEERGFSGCLDYIWSDSAILHRLAPRPSYELLNKYGALPSRIAPSDHVPLICEVKF